jgi:spore germination protein YaaH
MTTTMTRLLAPSTALVLSLVGCGYPSGEVDDIGDSVVARRGAVIVEGCALDEQQTATLASTGAHQVLSEVILLCAAPQGDGTVLLPAEPDRPTVAKQVADLRALGYRVSLGFTAPESTTGDGRPPLRDVLMDETKRGALAASIAGFADAVGADHVDLALPAMISATNEVTAFVIATQRQLQTHSRLLGVFAPPSDQSPSDILGGESYDLWAIGPNVDRIRLMTLDYSCCGGTAGPTTDPGWTVDVARLAATQTTGAQIDIAYPLYGYDFGGPKGPSPVGYAAATALAVANHANVVRGPTGAPSFSYRDAAGATHSVWYDDATSTLRALRAWKSDVLSTDVGVVYYGLGAEDPALFSAIAAAQVKR